MTEKKREKQRKPILSLFRRKIEDQNYKHVATLNRNLDSFGVKLIKAIGVVAAVIGLAVLISFWVWVIRWLYQVW